MLGQLKELFSISRWGFFRYFSPISRINGGSTPKKHYRHYSAYYTHITSQCRYYGGNRRAYDRRRRCRRDRYVDIGAARLQVAQRRQSRVEATANNTLAVYSRRGQVCGGITTTITISDTTELPCDRYDESDYCLALVLSFLRHVERNLSLKNSSVLSIYTR